jgi:enoyl-CoA hydratase
VVPADQLISKATEILLLIQTKAPIAIAQCIQAANAVYNETTDGYAVEVAGFGTSFDTADRVEGTTAFLEKRKAVFTGK